MEALKHDKAVVFRNYYGSMLVCKCLMASSNTTIYPWNMYSYDKPMLHLLNKCDDSARETLDMSFVCYIKSNNIW